MLSYLLRRHIVDDMLRTEVPYDRLGERKGVRMIDYKDIGARVRFYRSQNNLSQEDLAEVSKLSRVHISCIERGERIPSLEAIINIANALNISLDELLVGNLMVSAVTYDPHGFDILSDCSPAELRIIKKTMICLKEALRGL